MFSLFSRPYFPPLLAIRFVWSGLRTGAGNLLRQQLSQVASAAFSTLYDDMRRLPIKGIALGVKFGKAFSRICGLQQGPVFVLARSAPQGVGRGA